MLFLNTQTPGGYNKDEPNQKKKSTQESNKETEEEIFAVEEIKIEELAIDGICGVY